MRHWSRLATPKTLSAIGLAAALSALGLSTQAAAAVQAGVGSYNLGTDVATGATASPQTACGSGGQDALIFTGSGGNNIGIHSYSCGFGLYEFGSRSSGEGTYYVDGSGSVIGDISISGGGLSIFVSPGQVGAFGSTAFVAGEYQRSELSIELKIRPAGSTDAFTTYLDEDWFVEIGTGGAVSNGYTSSGTDSVINSFTSGAGYASYAVTGQSYFFGLSDGLYEIDYVISSLARGKITTTTSCRGVIGDGGIGEGDHEGGPQFAAFVGEEGGDGSFAAYCGAGAQSGDPFPALARELPEPGSMALIGLAGLLGMGARRRAASRR
jgi:PEP-CTERM motif